MISRLSLVLATTIFVVAGCGGSSTSAKSGGSSNANDVASKSADQIVVAAKAAADTATSVHVSGSANGFGLDLHVTAGNGGSGRLSENKLVFDLVRVGPSVYIRGGAAFFRHFAGPAAAQLFQGKWLKAPAGRADMASLTNLTDLHKLMNALLATHGALKKADTRMIGGQSAIGVTDLTKGGTLYVAASGPAYPLEVTKSGASAGTVSFDHWNQKVTVAAPVNVIDISKLTKP